MDLLSILGNIGFDWRVALANFVNFLIIFYLLKRFAFGPLQKLLRERTQKIEKGLEDARKAETDLLMAGQEREQIVAGARMESNSIVAHAREEEESIIAHAHEKAGEEAATIVADARLRAEKAAEESEEALRRKAIELTIASTEKVLREKLDRAADEKLITAALAKM